MSDNKFYEVIWHLFLSSRPVAGRQSFPVPVTPGGIFGSEHLSIVQTDLRCATAAGPNTLTYQTLLIPKLLHKARCQSLRPI